MKPNPSQRGGEFVRHGVLSVEGCRSLWIGLAVLTLASGLVMRAGAQCDLQIVSAGPCLPDGSAGTPAEGENYGLRVVVNVVGTPTNSFRIKWTLANVTYYFDNINLGPGNGYWWYFEWTMNLDDPIPWSVTLDPDGTSGDTNLANNVAGGTFTPGPPTNVVQLYEARLVGGSETALLDYTNGGGSNLAWEIFGQPTSHGAQKVMHVTAPSNATCIVTAPYGVPVLQIARTNPPTAVYQDTETFTAQLSGMCVNPTILRGATWADLAGMSSNWTQWLVPDQICESTNPAITNFVAESLPANFQSTLTPYDTARLLHLAVMRALTYQEPPYHADAVGVLQDGVADCGGFSALLTACLRCVGIPARRISGFWLGDTWPSSSQDFNTQWHVRAEFHLPVSGVDWLVADATVGNGLDPTGTYAYDFGYVPDANDYFAVDVGDAHELPYYNFPMLQVPNLWFYSEGIFYFNYACQYYLQPLGQLSVSNFAAGSFRFNLTNAPGDGSIIIETSTNLVSWSPGVTNAASANTNSFSYTFPAVITGRQFFRANQIP